MREKIFERLARLAKFSRALAGDLSSCEFRKGRILANPATPSILASDGSVGRWRVARDHRPLLIAERR